MGFLEKLRLSLSRATGAYRCQKQIDMLHYLLNHYTDITKLHPAEGPLRKLQLCDAVMLNIFAQICRREGWTYWLAWGTLLGAVRHKGFIPWDDDMDVMMPREDFYKAKAKLEEIFASYGNDTLSLHHDGERRLCFSYKHIQTGIWCDIFPVDTINAPAEDIDTCRKLLAGKIRRYKRYYKNHKDKISPEAMREKRERSVNTGKGPEKIALASLEFSNTPKVHTWDIVFPLSSVQFEGYTLNAPADTHEYLTMEYGDYMLYPREGAEHHDEGRGALSSWPERTGTNMDDILHKLRDIEEFFRQ